MHKALHVELIKIKSTEQMPLEINEKFIRSIVKAKNTSSNLQTMQIKRRCFKNM